MSNRQMSNRADLSLVQPIETHLVRGETRYPRRLVLWGLLTFCLSAWTGLALAVTHYV